MRLSGWKSPRRPSASDGQTVREDSPHLARDLGAEVPAEHADVQSDLERHEHRPVDLEVVARHPVPLQPRPQSALEGGVDRGTTEAVGGDERGVPRPGPAERRRGPLHLALRSATSA